MSHLIALEKSSEKPFFALKWKTLIAIEFTYNVMAVLVSQLVVDVCD